MNEKEKEEKIAKLIGNLNSEIVIGFNISFPNAITLRKKLEKLARDIEDVLKQ